MSKPNRPQPPPTTAQRFDDARPKRAPQSPPPYRPQPVPKVLQRKAAAAQPRPSAAPKGDHVPNGVGPLRPAPKVCQTKRVNAAQAQTPQRESRPVAPPVYRPQAKLVQPKMAATTPRNTPPAPPVYRPQPPPKVLQLKVAHAAVGAERAPSAARPQTPRPCAHVATSPRGGVSPSQVIQRVEIKVGKGVIETKTMSVIDLATLAQRLLKENNNMPTLETKAIYAAIEQGDHLDEPADDEGEDDMDGAPAPFILDDVADLLGSDEPDEQDAPSPSLLSRGEIIRLHKSAGALGAKGFRYDNLTTVIAAAQREGKIEHKIAVLVYGVVNGHTFSDGNKRTGKLMLAAMLRKNGKAIVWHGEEQALQDAADAARTGMTEQKFKEAITYLVTPPPKDWNPMGHSIL